MSNVTWDIKTDSEQLRRAAENALQQLEYRCRIAGLNPDKMGVFEADGLVYVLCNPIVNEVMVDTLEVVPRRNFEAWTKVEYDPMRITSGLKPVLAPWLAIKLDLEGNIIADGGDLGVLVNEATRQEAHRNNQMLMDHLSRD